MAFRLLLARYRRGHRGTRFRAKSLRKWRLRGNSIRCGQQSPARLQGAIKRTWVKDHPAPRRMRRAQSAQAMTDAVPPARNPSYFFPAEGCRELHSAIAYSGEVKLPILSRSVSQRVGENRRNRCSCFGRIPEEHSVLGK